MKTILTWLVLADRAVSITARTLSVLALAAIFVMFIANVFTRFVPVYNFQQTDDWIQFCLIWMIFLGAQELVRTRGHFVVDVLTERLAPSGLGRLLALVVALIELATYLVICYYGWIWVMKANAYAQSVPWLQMRWIYMAVPVSAFFMSCYGIRDVVKAATALCRKER